MVSGETLKAIAILMSIRVIDKTKMSMGKRKVVKSLEV
jgi:hypothetical protein